MLIMSSLKGISPLIAAVLLIAVTMTVAGIVATWAASFVKAQVKSAENQNNVMCFGAQFEVSNAKIVNGVGYFTLENSGSDILKDFKGYLFYDNPAYNEPIDPSKSYCIENPTITLANLTLRPGDVYTFNFSFSHNYPAKVRITPGNCPSSYDEENIIT